MWNSVSQVEQCLLDETIGKMNTEGKPTGVSVLYRCRPSDKCRIEVAEIVRREPDPGATMEKEQG